MFSWLHEIKRIQRLAAGKVVGGGGVGGGGETKKQIGRWEGCDTNGRL
jgi:hypothetical protein